MPRMLRPTPLLSVLGISDGLMVHILKSHSGISINIAFQTCFAQAMMPTQTPSPLVRKSSIRQLEPPCTVGLNQLKLVEPTTWVVRVNWDPAQAPLVFTTTLNPGRTTPAETLFAVCSSTTRRSSKGTSPTVPPTPSLSVKLQVCSTMPFAVPDVNGPSLGTLVLSSPSGTDLFTTCKTPRFGTSFRASTVDRFSSDWPTVQFERFQTLLTQLSSSCNRALVMVTLLTGMSNNEV